MISNQNSPQLYKGTLIPRDILQDTDWPWRENRENVKMTEKKVVVIAMDGSVDSDKALDCK